MKVCLWVLWVAVFILPSAATTPGSSAGGGARDRGMNSPAATSMERKLRYLEANGASSHPNPAPTEFTEDEINAYLASGEIQLPAGVKSVRLQETPGVVRGSARVDFDQMRAGRGSLNPLLGIFSGVHDVTVVAHAHGAGGKAIVHVDSVSLDGVEVPRFVLQLFVETYVQPKYPRLGLDSRFDLPYHIDSATVGPHKLTVTQRRAENQAALRNISRPAQNLPRQRAGHFSLTDYGHAVDQHVFHSLG
jgi:hypothetical protein